ncbi:unnamed protein product, partial [Amoebophrya sp. A120]
AVAQSLPAAAAGRWLSWCLRSDGPGRHRGRSAAGAPASLPRCPGSPLPRPCPGPAWGLAGRGGRLTHPAGFLGLIGGWASAYCSIWRVAKRVWLVPSVCVVSCSGPTRVDARNG